MSKDGGPAFPRAPFEYSDDFLFLAAKEQHGLTIRQYYKAAALMGILAHGTGAAASLSPEQDAAIVADMAGIFADAALKEDEEHADAQ